MICGVCRKETTSMVIDVCEGCGNQTRNLRSQLVVRVKKIVLLLGIGMDKVSLETDLPSGCPKVDPTNLVTKFEVETGKGLEYVRTHFGREPDEIIDVNRLSFKKGSSEL